MDRDNLTPAQLSFADEQEAQPGSRAEASDAVYFYVRIGHTTTRWLVDGVGRVLDTTSFRDQ